MTPNPIHEDNKLWPVILDRADLLLARNLFVLTLCDGSSITGLKWKINSDKAPVTRVDARWAGR